MGSKKTTNTTTQGTQTAAPPSWTMPGIVDAAARVTDAIKQLPGTKYTGDFTAAPNAQDIAGATSLYRGMAGNAQGFSDLVGGVARTLPQNVSYDMGSPTDLNPVINAALDPSRRMLMENILPSIRSGGIESGAYSGSRALQTLPGMALNDWSREANNTAATIGYEDYLQRENRRLQATGMDRQYNLSAAQLLPELASSSMMLGTSGGDLLTRAAELEAAREQSIIQNNLAKNQYEWMYPFQGLDIGADLLAKLSGNYGTQTSSGSSKTVEKTGGAGAVVQGIAGLASGIGGLMAGGPMAGLFGKAPGGAMQGMGLGGALQAAAPFQPGQISNLFGRPGGF